MKYKVRNKSTTTSTSTTTTSPYPTGENYALIVKAVLGIPMTRAEQKRYEEVKFGLYISDNHNHTTIKEEEYILWQE